MYRLTWTSLEPNHRNPDFSTLHTKKVLREWINNLLSQAFAHQITKGKGKLLVVEKCVLYFRFFWFRYKEKTKNPYVHLWLHTQQYHSAPPWVLNQYKPLSFKGAFRLETKSFPQAAASISWHLQKTPHHLQEQTMLKLFLRPDPQTNPKGFAMSEIRVMCQDLARMPQNANMDCEACSCTKEDIPGLTSPSQTRSPQRVELVQSYCFPLHKLVHLLEMSLSMFHKANACLNQKDMTELSVPISSRNCSFFMYTNMHLVWNSWIEHVSEKAQPDH